MRLAVYPGSFDPITFGHLDVIERASRLFDRLVVAVLVNTRKSPSLSAGGPRAASSARPSTRSCRDLAAGIEVTAFEGLTVELARQRGAMAIVRGLRAVSDFENELAIAHLNRKLAPSIDTVFFMTGLEHAYLSSSLVREIAAFGGDVSAHGAARRPIRRPAARAEAAAARPDAASGLQCRSRPRLSKEPLPSTSCSSSSGSRLSSSRAAACP